MILKTLVLSISTLLSLLGGRGPETQYIYPISINEILTNSMSERPELRRMDHAIDSFMTYWDIKGASLAIMKNDSLLYAKGYGWADKEKGRPMTPGTTMRMASVSKLVTAIGIMVLQEKGLLNLQTPVFGPFGILNEYDKYITDDNYYMMTVEHLLRHQGGFPRRFGDPMFSTRTIMQQNRLSKAPDTETLLKLELPKQLDFEPGSSQSYSNFGYLLLSLIIEKVSGKSYEQFMQEEVLRKAGCFDFHIAGNHYEDAYKGESKYYAHSDCQRVLDLMGSGMMVEIPYGGNDITALKGAGAWIGSSIELARLMSSINGLMRVPDILGFFSIAQMTEYYDEETYPLGWVDAREDGELTRTGSFTGTSAIIKYYPDGECWIMITNTSTWRGSRFTKNTAGLFANLRRRFSKSLPLQDLFLER